MAGEHRAKNAVARKARRAKGRHGAASPSTDAYVWLGAGALTLGIGAALANGTAVAQAESNDSSSSSATDSSNPADASRNDTPDSNGSATGPPAAGVSGIANTDAPKSTTLAARGSVESAASGTSNVVKVSIGASPTSVVSSSGGNLSAKSADNDGPVKITNVESVPEGVGSASAETGATSSLFVDAVDAPAVASPFTPSAWGGVSLGPEKDSGSMTPLVVRPEAGQNISHSETDGAKSPPVSVQGDTLVSPIAITSPTVSRTAVNTVAAATAPGYTIDDAYLAPFLAVDPTQRFAYTRFLVSQRGTTYDGQPMTDAELQQFVASEGARYGYANFSRNAQGNLVYRNTTAQDVMVGYGGRPDRAFSGAVIVRPGMSVTLPNAPLGSYASANRLTSGDMTQDAIIAIAYPGAPIPATSGGGSNGGGGVSIGGFGQSPIAGLIRSVGGALGLVSIVDAGLTFVERVQATFQRPLGLLSRVFLPQISAVTTLLGAPEAADDVTSGNPTRIVRGGATIIAGVAAGVAYAPFVPPPIRAIAAGVALGASVVGIFAGLFG